MEKKQDKKNIDCVLLGNQKSEKTNIVAGASQGYI